jgi:hypothetical protein
MKRIFGLALLATGLAGLLESSAFAKAPPGIGSGCRRVGRIEGYWLSGPTRGPLYDYSSYFATLYPYLPGAQEYQWQATVPGQFGTAMAILPTSPPFQAQPAPGLPAPGQPRFGQPVPGQAPSAATPAFQTGTVQTLPIQSQPIFRRR